MMNPMSFFKKSLQNSQNRPNIIVKPSIFFKALDYFNIIAIVILLICTILIFQSLPDEIPVHFTWDGSVDYWSSKYFLFLEVFILFFIVGILSYFTRFYTNFNYPVEITKENAYFQYSLALKFFSIMKTLNVFLFSYIYYVMVLGAFHPEKAYLDLWFWILILIICSSTFIYKAIAKSLSEKSKTE